MEEMEQQSDEQQNDERQSPSERTWREPADRAPRDHSSGPRNPQRRLEYLRFRRDELTDTLRRIKDDIARLQGQARDTRAPRELRDFGDPNFVRGYVTVPEIADTFAKLRAFFAGTTGTTEEPMGDKIYFDSEVLGKQFAMITLSKTHALVYWAVEFELPQKIDDALAMELEMTRSKGGRQDRVTVRSLEAADKLIEAVRTFV